MERPPGLGPIALEPPAWTGRRRAPGARRARPAGASPRAEGRRAGDARAPSPRAWTPARRRRAGRRLQVAPQLVDEARPEGRLVGVGMRVGADEHDAAARAAEHHAEQPALVLQPWRARFGPRRRPWSDREVEHGLRARGLGKLPSTAPATSTVSNSQAGGAVGGEDGTASGPARSCAVEPRPVLTRLEGLEEGLHGRVAALARLGDGWRARRPSPARADLGDLRAAASPAAASRGGRPTACGRRPARTARRRATPARGPPARRRRRPRRDEAVGRIERHGRRCRRRPARRASGRARPPATADTSEVSSGSISSSRAAGRASQRSASTYGRVDGAVPRDSPRSGTTRGTCASSSARSRLPTCAPWRRTTTARSRQGTPSSTWRRRSSRATAACSSEVCGAIHAVTAGSATDRWRVVSWIRSAPGKASVANRPGADGRALEREDVRVGVARGDEVGSGQTAKDRLRRQRRVLVVVDEDVVEQRLDHPGRRAPPAAGARRSPPGSRASSTPRYSAAKPRARASRSSPAVAAASRAPPGSGATPACATGAAGPRRRTRGGRGDRRRPATPARPGRRAVREPSRTGRLPTGPRGARPSRSFRSRGRARGTSARADRGARRGAWRAASRARHRARDATHDQGDPFGLGPGFDQPREPLPQHGGLARTRGAGDRTGPPRVVEDLGLRGSGEKDGASMEPMLPAAADSPGGRPRPTDRGAAAPRRMRSRRLGSGRGTTGRCPRCRSRRPGPRRRARDRPRRPRSLKTS